MECEECLKQLTEKDKPFKCFNKGYDKGVKDTEKVYIQKERGCTGCAFESMEEWEMPCAKCKRKMKDYWRGKLD